jgi:hypothetical protein
VAQLGGVQIDPRFLPTLNDEPVAKKRSAVGAGLSAGIDEAQGLVGSALQGVGMMTGISGLESFGQRQAERNELEAQRNGRSDLEVAPWKDGGAPVLPWLTYQAAKQIPLLATYIGAGAFVPEAAVPAALARAGAIAPRVLGGGGLRAGADFASRRAADAAGRSFGKTVIGAEIAGTPLGFGSMVQEAASKPEGANSNDVLKAALAAPVYAALDAVEPAQIKGLLARGLNGNIGKRVLSAGLAGAAMEVPQEGLQTAMEVSFRPDLSTSEKMTRIVDAAVTGGAVSGLFGGIGGIRRAKSLEAQDISTEDLDAITSEVLGLPAPQAFTDAAGRTTIGSGGDELLRATPLTPGEPALPEFVSSAPPALDSQSVIVDPSGAATAPTASPSNDDLSRPYRDVANAELKAGLGAAIKRMATGNAGPEIELFAQKAQEELDRRVNQSASETSAQPVTGAVERNTADGSGGADGVSSAPAPTSDFAVRLADLKAQAGKTQFIAQLEATDEQDLLDKVHEKIIVEGAGGKKLEKLGKAVGLLDDDGMPTPLADEISARKADYAELNSIPEGLDIEDIGGQHFITYRDGETFVSAQLSVASDGTGVIDIQGPGQGALGSAKLRSLMQQISERTGIASIRGVRTSGARGSLAEADPRKVQHLGKAVGLLDDNGKPTPLADEISARKTGPQEEAAPLTFRTAKGSTYQLNSDGTTTRNKAYRPEHGEAEQGPQPKSDSTFFVTAEDAEKLGEFQAQGGPKRAIRQLPDGRIGLMYLEGKDKGKFEARTVVTPQAQPAVGLTPVELWKDGSRVHFGNAITSVDTPASAAPDTGFQAIFREELSQHRGAAIQELRKNPPKSEAEARRILFDALGANTSDDVKVDGYQGVVKMAEKYGIIDKDGQLTEVGTQVAREALPLEFNAQEAMGRGYTGSEVSAFDRGARGDRAVKLGSISELKAYNDGRDWAINRESKNAPIPRVASTAATEKVLREGTAQVDEKGVPVRQAVTSAGIPEKQQNQQFLNQAIDQVYSSTLQPSEIGNLKRMVREGATGEELDEAVRYMKTGRGALLQDQPVGVTRDTFRGETVTRGAPRVSNANTLAREAEVEQAAQGRQSLLSSAAAIEVHAERQKQRAVIRERIQALAEEVEEELALERETNERELKVDSRGVLKAARLVSTGEIYQRDEALGNRLLTKFTSRDRVVAARNYLREKAPNAFYRELARHIDRTTRTLEARGWIIDVRIPRPGDRVPAEVLTSNGLTEGHGGLGRITVWLNERTGVNYGILLHEMVHAVTIASIEEGKRAAPDSQIGKAAKDLLEVTARIKDHFKFRAPESEFERHMELGLNNALDDEHEIVAWALTDPRMQEYLNSIPYNPHQSFWSRLIEAIRNLFGLDAEHGSALEEVLRVSQELMELSPAVNDLYTYVRENGAQDETIVYGQRKNAFRVTQQMREGIARATGVADRMVQQAPRSDGALRRLALPWATVNDITEHFGKWFERERNGVKEYQTALSGKHAIVAKMSQMLTDVRDSYQRLLRTDDKSAKAIVQLMRLTEFGINPMKPWTDQTAEVQKRPNLKPLHDDAFKLYRGTLVRKGTAKVYHDLRTVNDVLMLSQMGVTFFHQVVNDPLTGAKGGGTSAISGFGVDPMDEFMAEQAKRVMSLDDTRMWWEQKLNEQMSNLGFFLKHMGYSTDPTMHDRVDPLEKRASNIKATMRQLEQTPYFHLGRYGDFFVNFHIRKSGKDGVDEKALADIADYMDKKGFGAIISKQSDRGNVFMRVENEATQAEVLKAVRELQKRGLIDKVVNKAGEDQSVKVGKRTDDSIRNTAADDWVTRMIADIEQDKTIDDKAKSRLVEALQDYALDLMPENSISRVMTERESIPGFDADMMRSFEWRAQVGINALAGMTTAPKMSRAFTEMRTAVNDAAHGAGAGANTANQANGMQEVVDELSKREAERPTWPNTPILDQLRAVNHAWFLGFSVSYGLVNMTQLGATLLPELGSKYGFSRAFSAIAEATPTALRIFRAIASEGAKVSMDRAMDAVLTRTALEKAGIHGKTAEFIMRVANTGNLDIGGPSRELGRAAEGRGNDKLDRVLRWASAIGYYTETGTRLIAALATLKLNPNLSAEAAAEKAAHVLNESMWDYSQANQGRKFGKRGMLGEFTPLVTSFMQYTAQLTGKLYREVYDSIKGETAAERQEARRYLAGHLAAMTFLAGSLGLPAVTAFAAAFDRLKDLFDDDDEPSNIRAAYRQWLSELVGSDIEPIISRGASRAIGIDISTRVGEQDIIPFSKFIGDRRKFRDAMKDFQSRAWGAPASMIMNAVEGGERLMEGDIEGGLARMSPNFLSAPVKAVNMGADGNFTDAQGNVLPIEPSTRDVMVQLFGFQPAQRADYNEVRDANKIAKGQLTRRATTLRNKLVKAITAGDETAAREYILEAQQFDRAHPSLAVLPDISAAISRRARLQAISARTKSPIGENPADRNRYRFGDIEFRAQ